MDHLQRIQVFVRVAERGAFSAAGRDLGLTQPAVSKAMGSLEAELGTRLVQRSPRGVALTEAGQAYYLHARNVLTELEAGKAAVAGVGAGISGRLRIAAPVPFGLMFVSPAVVRFQARHPTLAMSLALDDRHVDLVEENIDIAIRLGRIGAGDLAARKLGDSPFLTVAAPDYLARRGEPARPDALSGHDCLVYAPSPGPLLWEFEASTGVAPIAVAGCLEANNLLVLRDAARAGLGIARLPLWMVAEDMEMGRLRRIMTDFPAPAFAIHAVFPSPRRIPAKARSFADFMAGELAASACFTLLPRAANPV